MSIMNKSISPGRTLLLGVVLLMLGALAFTSAIYYGWLSVTPGCEGGCISKFSKLSSVLGYSSYALLLAGIAAIVAFIVKKIKARAALKIS
ncbi:hypothetical protein [Solilutibacter pythonis]|uniref:hypothetical protein n=1 Tax=Solilutibacter pythonis TaxID=2483112 RepID=UPI0011C495A8|nr:hypothetical protein [Lysobacter pythonis]